MQAKVGNKKLNSYKFISDVAESNFTMISHLKLILFLHSMLSKTLSVMLQGNNYCIFH